MARPLSTSGPQLLHLEYEVRIGNGVGPGKVTGSFWLRWSICLFCLVLRTPWWNNQTLRLLWVIWILTWTRELTSQVSQSRDCGASPLWDMGAEWTGLGLGSWQIGALGSGPPRERHPYVNDRMRDSISGYTPPPSPSPASFNHLSQEFQICRWLLLKLVHKVPYPILSEYAVL